MTSVPRALDGMPPSLKRYKPSYGYSTPVNKPKKWPTAKPGARYPPLNKYKIPHRLPHPPKSQWKYSKIQLKAHLMLPEPLPIPKSVLYDYKKKKIPPRLPVRSYSTDSQLSSDSGVDDLSDTASEHSEWESLFLLDDVCRHRTDHCRIAPPPTIQPAVVGLRPIEPVPYVSEVGASKSPIPLGQLQFQCARCFIVYPSVILIEQHIGQFHMRLPEGQVFHLSEDNFQTLVKATWETTDIRRLPEAPLSTQIQKWTDFSLYGELVTSLEERKMVNCSSDGDSGMETDGSESFLDSANSSVFEEDFFSSAGNSFYKNSGMISGGKSGNGMMRKLLSHAMKSVNEIICPATVRELEDSFPPRLVPKKLKLLNRDKIAQLIIKKSARKCRGVYGIDHQDRWCNMCKWKKRCSRFSHLEIENENDDVSEVQELF